MKKLDIIGIILIIFGLATWLRGLEALVGLPVVGYIPKAMFYLFGVFPITVPASQISIIYPLTFSILIITGAIILLREKIKKVVRK